MTFKWFKCRFHLIYHLRPKLDSPFIPSAFGLIDIIYSKALRLYFHHFLYFIRVYPSLPPSLSTQTYNVTTSVFVKEFAIIHAYIDLIDNILLIVSCNSAQYAPQRMVYSLYSLHSLLIVLFAIDMDHCNK